MTTKIEGDAIKKIEGEPRGGAAPMAAPFLRIGADFGAGLYREVRTPLRDADADASRTPALSNGPPHLAIELRKAECSRYLRGIFDLPLTKGDQTARKSPHSS